MPPQTVRYSCFVILGRKFALTARPVFGPIGQQVDGGGNQKFGRYNVGQLLVTDLKILAVEHPHCAADAGLDTGHNVGDIPQIRRKRCSKGLGTLPAPRR